MHLCAGSTNRFGMPVLFFATILRRGTVAAAFSVLFACPAGAHLAGAPAPTPGVNAFPGREGAAGKAATRQKSGDRLLQRGDLRGAAREYALAALAAPGDPLFRLTTGVALSALREGSGAVAQFEQAQSFAEDDVVAALLLQGALEEQGQTTRAQRLYLDTVRRFGQTGQAGLNASGSIRRLLDAVQRFPESPVVHLLLGDAYQVAERWRDGADAYHKAIRLAPRWAKPLVNLGVLRLAEGQPDAAVKAFSNALALDPGNLQVQLLKGDAQADMGLRKDALQTYREVGNAPAKDAKIASVFKAQAETRIGRVYLQNKKLEDALRSFERAQKLAPGDLAPTAGTAEVHVQAGNFQAGAEAYRSALRLATAGGLLSTRPVLYRGLAEAQMSARNPDAALQTLARALGDEPQSAPLWHRLAAQAHFAKADLQAGQTALKAALDSETGRYPVETLKALDAQGLVAPITTAYTVDLAGPNRLTALVALAHLARYRGDVAGEVAFRKQVTGARARGTDWFLLAEAWERARRPADARDAYTRAMRLGGLSPAASDWAHQRLKALQIR